MRPFNGALDRVDRETRSTTSCPPCFHRSSGSPSSTRPSTRPDDFGATCGDGSEARTGRRDVLQSATVADMAPRGGGASQAPLFPESAAGSVAPTTPGGDEHTKGGEKRAGYDEGPQRVRVVPQPSLVAGRMTGTQLGAHPPHTRILQRRGSREVQSAADHGPQGAACAHGNGGATGATTNRSKPDNGRGDLRPKETSPAEISPPSSLPPLATSAAAVSLSRSADLQHDYGALIPAPHQQLSPDRALCAPSDLTATSPAATRRGRKPASRVETGPESIAQRQRSSPDRELPASSNLTGLSAASSRRHFGLPSHRTVANRKEEVPNLATDAGSGSPALPEGSTDHAPLTCEGRAGLAPSTSIRNRTSNAPLSQSRAGPGASGKKHGQSPVAPVRSAGKGKSDASAVSVTRNPPRAPTKLPPSPPDPSDPVDLNATAELESPSTPVASVDHTPPSVGVERVPTQQPESAMLP